MENNRIYPQMPSSDIWLIHYPDFSSKVTYYESLLCVDEVKQANRFYFPKDRIRYTITHGILRLLIGNYLKIQPKDVIFYKNQYGKPFILTEINYIDLKFNISHSRDGIVMVFSQGKELGIDIEYLKKDIPVNEIAERFFSSFEVQKLNSLPESQQFEAFYNCWTRKESYIKAIGKGLSIPLDSFDVTLVPGEPPLLLRSLTETTDILRWDFHEIETWPNYLSSLCIERGDVKIQIHNWTE